VKIEIEETKHVWKNKCDSLPELVEVRKKKKEREGLKM
jgi:hypothetical protein